MKYAAGATLSAGLESVFPDLADSAMASVSESSRNLSHDRWNFLYVPPVKAQPRFDKSLEDRLFFKIDGPVQMFENQELDQFKKDVMPYINKFMDDMKKSRNPALQGKVHFDIKPVEIMYQVAETPDITGNHILYCRVQEDFLREKGFSLPEISWKPVSEFDNKDKTVQGLVGQAICFQRFAEIYLKGKIFARTKAISYFSHVSYSMPLKKVFGVCTGETAISAGISEMLPFYTAPATTSFIRDKTKSMGSSGALLLGRMLDESIVEAASYLLLDELIKDMNVPDGAYLREKNYSMMITDPYYAYVPNAVTWMKKNSVKAAFDLYTTKGPAAWKDAIRI